MIKDKPYWFLKWFFILVENYICRHFARLSFIGTTKPSEDKATLVLMNHFSFNDGALTHRFCRKVLQKKFKAMVVEDQMRSFFLLKYGGCFSINKKSRSMIYSLNYAASLLNQPENALVIFPQGEVFSFHLNKIKFEPGIERILKKKAKDIQIILAVTLLDYLDSFRPKANFYYQEYSGLQDLIEIEKAYNAFYKECKIKQQKQHHPPEEILG